MKNIVKILISLLFTLQATFILGQSDELVNVCALSIGNATYLKDYVITSYSIHYTKLYDYKIKSKWSVFLC